MEVASALSPQECGSGGLSWGSVNGGFLEKYIVLLLLRRAAKSNVANKCHPEGF